MTTITSCETKGCKNDFQDETYGVGKRVMNKIKPSDSTNKEYACTVCGKTKSLGVDTKKKK